jgi:hypothetical protein
MAGQYIHTCRKPCEYPMDFLVTINRLGVRKKNGVLYLQYGLHCTHFLLVNSYLEISSMKANYYSS